MLFTDDWGKAEFRRYAREAYDYVLKLKRLGLSSEDLDTCSTICRRLHMVDRLMTGKLTRRVRERATGYLEWADNETAIVMVSRLGHGYFREPRL